MIRRSSDTKAKRRPKRISLRLWGLLETVNHRDRHLTAAVPHLGLTRRQTTNLGEHWQEELMQARERQLRLRLDPRRAQYPDPLGSRAPARLDKQRGLADPWLTGYHQRPPEFGYPIDKSTESRVRPYGRRDAEGTPQWRSSLTSRQTAATTRSGNGPGLRDGDRQPPAGHPRTTSSGVNGHGLTLCQSPPVWSQRGPRIPHRPAQLASPSVAIHPPHYRRAATD